MKPILEKIKSSCGSGSGASKAEPKASTGNKTSREEKNDAPKPNSFAKAAEEKKKTVSKRETSTSRSRPVAKPPVSARGKPTDDEDEVRIKPLNKGKRATADTRNKFPQNEVKGDHIDKLMGFCADAFGLKFHDLMFAKAVDFNKHIKCAEQFDKFISSQPDELIEVLDVVFKWANVRMNESSNTKLAVSILDLFANILQFLIEADYALQDFEAVVLLGTLCDKTGLNSKPLLEKVRKLIRMTYMVYDKKLAYRVIIDHGVKNKNLRAVAECLDAIAEYIVTNGIENTTKKDFALFISCADASDKGVRENSLKVFAESYTIIGEDVWLLLPKDVPIKVKGLLESRFKQVAKKVGVPGNSLNLSTSSASKKIGGLGVA